MLSSSHIAGGETNRLWELLKQARIIAGRDRRLEGHTPLTFTGGHTVARAELNNVRWVSPTAGIWPSSR